ncbi:MAG TPA: TIGR01777 family oxidoreductase [Bryobacteraceae bacterium]|nr:TIGR01777 family oxidoreductase [Bryobacteraceae bacterium]
MRVAVTGASGFIGRRLVARLVSEAAEVVTLGRKPAAQRAVDFIPWQASDPVDKQAFNGIDAVIHLAGEPVAQRWSAEVKKRIHDSRVIGTRNVVTALWDGNSRPRVMVAASAVGYYGDRGEEVLTERSRPGNDFLAQTCVKWEAESRRAEELAVRVVMLRTGIVLGAGGGALATMVPPFRAGVGGPVGSGKQWVPWIHLDDMVEIIMWALHDTRVSGPVNATAPHPVRNAEFAKELGHALGRPSLVPVPAFGLKLMYGEMAGVVLGSQRVVPEGALAAGYTFRHPELGPALRQILS